MTNMKTGDHVRIVGIHILDSYYGDWKEIKHRTGIISKVLKFDGTFYFCDIKMDVPVICEGHDPDRDMTFYRVMLELVKGE